MDVRMWSSQGRYNLCSNEEQVCINLRVIGGKAISQTWDLDDAPEIEGLLPSEVLELISERLESYWLATSRERDREVIAWFREHSAQVDSAWAKSKIKHLKEKIDELKAVVLEEEPSESKDD